MVDGDAADFDRFGILAAIGRGRILCFLLSLYGFAVLGYVTATLATFFIGRDAENEEAELAGAKSTDQTLFCSDLFFHPGKAEPLIEAGVVERARETILSGAVLLELAEIIKETLGKTATDQ